MEETYTLITGASSGIGRGIAQQLANSRKLILAGRNLKRLEAVCQRCERSGQHLLWGQDLSQVESVGESLAAWLSARGISIDHFVHSAGLIEIQPVRNLDLAITARLFNVNLFSAVEIIRQLVRRRINNGALRSITFISAASSRVATKGSSLYAASKGAVNALTRALAVEFAPAVRVNAVLPGLIETEGTRRFFADARFVEAMKAAYPLGLGRPEDVASAVEFLLSDRARWITGQEIVVDGGKSISLEV